MTGHRVDERLERTDAGHEFGPDVESTVPETRRALLEQGPSLLGRRVAGQEERDADVAPPDEVGDERQDPVDGDLARERHEQPIDRPRGARDHVRPRVDVVGDPVEGLTPVGSEHQPVVGVAAGLPELLGDVLERLGGARLVLEPCLVGRGLLGEDVVAQDGDVHRAEQVHQPERHRFTLKHPDRDEDTGHHRAPFSSTSRA